MYAFGISARRSSGVTRPRPSASPSTRVPWEVSSSLRARICGVQASPSTYSGAPKIRACQLIGELENNKRGIYGGAIGYIDFAGNMDTCIAIRIAYKKNGKVFVRSGAGIVYDSVPEKEHEECLNKARAVLNSLDKAGKEIDG